MVELADLHGARIIGPNCLGIIVPDVIKMGGIGGPAKDAAKAYSPGPIGVISPLRRHDDGDVLDAHGRRPGPVDGGLDRRRRDHRPAYAELMPLFEADAETEGIVIYTEPGGRMEAQLAEWVTEQRLAAADRRLHGRQVHGRDAGHVLRARRHDRRGQGGHGHGEDRPAAEAGITVAEEISQIPELVKAKLAEREVAV